MRLFETVYVSAYWWSPMSDWGWGLTRSAKHFGMARFYWLDLGPLEIRARL
jgi:hypothetical protein